MPQLIAPRLLFLLSIVSLTSCAAQRSPAPAATTTQPPPPAKAVDTGPASAVGMTSEAPADAAPLPARPRAIELAGKRACSWRTSAFRGTLTGGGSELRLRKGGPVFARVDSGNVTITVPEGRADVALIEASSEGVFISGIADASSINFFPAKPFVMDGFVVPASSATLRLTAANADEVSVKLTLPDEVIVPKRTLEETRPCGDVGTGPSTFDTMAPVFGTRTGAHLLMSGGLAELSLRPDGPRVATLRIPTDGAFVFSFDEQQGRSLIGWQTSSGMAFGWVRSARLEQTNVGIGGSHGIGFGRPGAGRIATVAYVRCDQDLPLIGEADGHERTVGRIMAGTTVRIAKWGEPRSRVVVETRDIHEQHGTFSARTAELRACRNLAPTAAGPALR